MNIDTAPIVQAAFTATGVTFRADATTATAGEDNDFPDMDLDLELEDDQLQLHMPAPLQEKPQYGIHMNPSLSPSTSFDAATLHDSTANVKCDDEDDENAMLSPETFDEARNAAEVGSAQQHSTHDSDGDHDSGAAVEDEQEKVEEEKEDLEFTQWMAGLEEFVEIV